MHMLCITLLMVSLTTVRLGCHLVRTLDRAISKRGKPCCLCASFCLARQGWLLYCGQPLLSCYVLADSDSSIGWYQRVVEEGC